MQIVIDIPDKMYEGVEIDRVLNTTADRILEAELRKEVHSWGMNEGSDK